MWVAPADAAPSGVALSARWCDGLAERMSAHPNLHLFDLAAVIAEHGRKLIYDDKMWYLGSAPYSLKGTRLVARALTDRVVRTQAKRKKVLVVDLDNTLWGGVLGEDGADGIVLSRSLTGAVYRDAQLRLKEIAATGVLLAIASKNDEDPVSYTHLDVYKRQPMYVIVQNRRRVSREWRSTSTAPHSRL